MKRIKLGKKDEKLRDKNTQDKAEQQDAKDDKKVKMKKRLD